MRALPERWQHLKQASSFVEARESIQKAFDVLLRCGGIASDRSGAKSGIRRLDRGDSLYDGCSHIGNRLVVRREHGITFGFHWGLFGLTIRITARLVSACDARSLTSPRNVSRASNTSLSESYFFSSQ